MRLKQFFFAYKIQIVHQRSSQDETKYKAELQLHISDVLEARLVAVDDDCGSQVG